MIGSSGHSGLAAGNLPLLWKAFDVGQNAQGVWWNIGVLKHNRLPAPMGHLHAAKPYSHKILFSKHFCAHGIFASETTVVCPKAFGQVVGAAWDNQHLCRDGTNMSPSRTIGRRALPGESIVVSCIL